MNNPLLSNPTAKKLMDFSIRIVNLYKILSGARDERVMSKQVLRSGTSIGANYCEAMAAESTNDFVHKLSISLKETNETIYWLTLLAETSYLNEVEYNSISKDCISIRKVLSAAILTAKKKISSKQ